MALSKIFAFILIGITSFAYFGANLNAKMGILDDHTIIERKILTGESSVIKNLLQAPEIVSFGQNDRFRLSYNLILDLQTTFFGDNVRWWYLINIIVFIIFASTSYSILSSHFPLPIAICLTLTIISQKYLAMIFTNLGTAETWTILGLSIFSIGLHHIYQSIGKKHKTIFIPWLLMTFGLLTTIGAKENMAPISLLLIPLASQLQHSHLLSPRYSLFMGIVFFANFYQISYLFLKQLSNPFDIYHSPLSLSSKINIIYQQILIDNTTVTLLATVIIISIINIVIVNVLTSKHQHLHPTLKDIVPYTIIFNIVYLFNLYVYNGKTYTDHRYAFPSILIVQIIFTYTLWLFTQSRLYRHIIVKLITIVLLGFCALSSFKASLEHNQIQSLQNVHQTTVFQNFLSHIIYHAKQCQNCPIIFSTWYPFDYESIQSASVYLRYHHISNPLMAKTNYQSLKIDDNPTLKFLTIQNRLLESNGGDFFEPYVDQKHQPCFEVTLSSESGSTNCQQLGKMWPIPHPQF